MIIKYLGTGAAEGIPAVFCHCSICQYARIHGGKDIRTRSQALIDKKILFDFGPDTYLHSLKYGINLADINVCFITHAHPDHLYAEDLKARRKSRANLCPGTPTLDVYGSVGVEKELQPDADGFITKDKRVCFHRIIAFESIRVYDYIITALPAVHGTEQPLVYIIEHCGKNFLYAHDSDYFDESTWKYLTEHHVVFDAISLDCTEGKKHIDYCGHMNFEKMERVCTRMKQEGLIYDHSQIVANHISHNGLMTYGEAVKVGRASGYTIAYDGIEITI